MVAAELYNTVQTLSDFVKTRNHQTRTLDLDVRAKIDGLSEEKRTELFTSLNEYMEIIREPEGQPRRETDLFHLRKFLAKKNWHLKDNDYQDMILDGDLIEVYDSVGAQVFRNLEFFNYCSYTVWEVATESWGNLYYRPSAITHAIMQEWSRITTSGGEQLIAMTVPAHVLREIGGNKNQCEINFKWAWPLFDISGHIRGTIVIVRAKKLSPDASELKFI